MAQKYYVVWEGRETGIFTTWAQCKAQVDKFAGARYKSFPSLVEAESAFGHKSSIQSSAAKTAKAPSKSKKTPLTQQQITDMLFDIKIFTDGASVPNPGEAGAGIAIYENNKISELWYGIYQAVGTNNTAELNGLHQAFILAKEKMAKGHSVAIYCDSTYAIQSITQWAAGWSKKGWTKVSGEIKNLDIIKPMYALYQEIANKVEIYHVNGHVGIEGNELADRMSIVAIESKDESLTLYRETTDIAKILALRAG
ncbi:ribonuclease H family protein [Aliivibrio sp. EL58]|uniref:ribonuclease H family protein n=1 Tax=Aliivibrio sp. EL58 TaxID=2107582 RepID=UPI000EFC7DE3|nr:ribonuclease H family protein [Aliivibrio sp. EL58]